MPWHITVHSDCGVVETQYAGVLTPQELTDAVKATIDAATEFKHVLLLGDCTRLAGGHSIVDLYGLADLILATGLAHVFKEAILLPGMPGAIEDVRFWENTCYNRGIRVRVFEDRKQAFAWLAQ